MEGAVSVCVGVGGGCSETNGAVHSKGLMSNDDLFER